MTDESIGDQLFCIKIQNQARKRKVQETETKLQNLQIFSGPIATEMKTSTIHKQKSPRVSPTSMLTAKSFVSVE